MVGNDKLKQDFCDFIVYKLMELDNGEMNHIVLEGGPGTGKTRIIEGLAQVLVNGFRKTIRICAPTGRAAKRIAENQALKKFKLKSDNWGLYGHGAGAHFVHRYVLYYPESSYTLAIAANPGWYLTMTDKQWPFGLKNSVVSKEMLEKSFQNYFLLMLGMSDISTKPNTDYVASIFDKVTDQGSHRLERGRNFFNGVLSKSRELDTFLKWGMVEVPTKDGHSNTKQMVPFAAELFFERLK